MNDEELTAIERRAAERDPGDGDIIASDTRRVCAEARRLRAIVEAVAASDPLFVDDDECWSCPLCGEMGLDDDGQPGLRAEFRHAPSCPWLAARESVGK